MQDNINEEHNRGEFLFQHLVAMFQTLALQQLGKLINPMTGETDRDLVQAKITIDMLDMIREKTKGNLNETEKQVLDRVLMELQMNYVTERERKEEGPGEEGAEEETEPGDRGERDEEESAEGDEDEDQN